MTNRLGKLVNSFFGFANKPKPITQLNSLPSNSYNAAPSSNLSGINNALYPHKREDFKLLKPTHLNKYEANRVNLGYTNLGNKSKSEFKLIKGVQYLWVYNQDNELILGIEKAWESPQAFTMNPLSEGMAASLNSQEYLDILPFQLFLIRRQASRSERRAGLYCGRDRV